MNKLLLAFFIFLNIHASQAQSIEVKKANKFSLPAGLSTKDYLPGVLIVKLKPGASVSKTLAANRFGSVKENLLLSVNKKFPEETSDNGISGYIKKNNQGLDRIFEIKFKTGSDIVQLINNLISDPEVEYAEPSYVHHTNIVPSDPLYISGQQTYLDVIKAPQAWNLIRNGSGVIIGIVDSGSELTHQDLAANIYHNTADPVNGIDDDHDGFTDNFAGWDLVGATGNIQPDNDPNVRSSDNDHGVHVSGIAGAVTDNNTGVASVSFNSAKLLIVKAGADNNGTDILRGFEGIKYAADHGANIINCSWGNEAGGSFGQDIVNYALDKGCMIVAAAGNDGRDSEQYPAAYLGVMAVANTRTDDVKASSSNYGDYIALSAPGTSITSTVFNNQFAAYTGTSMSSPLVAGAAALVKSAFPSMSMQQVGELLRVTADNIDEKNPSFAEKLGKGRLNVFRALSETPPSVRIQKVTEDEKHGSSANDPDILYLYFDIKNFLFPVANLQLKLSTTNTAVKIVEAQQLVTSLATLELKSMIGPFRISVPAGIASNTKITFRLECSANNTTYQDFESFSVVVARDYLDLSSNSLVTTITSNGRIGFSSPSASDGSGFVYKGQQLLYECSLMIGTSPAEVSNNARGVNGQHDNHFIKQQKARELINNADSIKAISEFDDRGSPLPLNLYVKHSLLVNKEAPDDKYAIAQYEIFNHNNFSLTGLYAGLFTDWDINGGGTNVTEFDSSNRLSYVYDPSQAGYYGGLKLLSSNAPPLYYPLSYMLSNNPLGDNDLTIPEKWETLSSGIKANSLGGAGGVDISFVSGNGPYEIPAHASIKVAFALIGGDDLQDLQVSAQRAQSKYDKIKAMESGAFVKDYRLKNYPNPMVSDFTSNTIQVTLPEESTLTLEIFNMLGQKVTTLFENRLYSKGIYELNYDFNDPALAGLKSGIYFYRLKFNSGVRTSKFSVLR